MFFFFFFKIAFTSTVAENQALVEMKDFYQSLKWVSLFLSSSLLENLRMKKTPVYLAFTRVSLLNFVEHLNHTSMLNYSNQMATRANPASRNTQIHMHIYLMCECGEYSTVFL
jgi:hypothetical protein